MNLVRVLKVILAVTRLLITLLTLVVTVWGVITAQWYIAYCCLLLTIAFGYYSYVDYEKFFRANNALL